MENVNWLEEVTSRKEDLFKDLFRLLKVESVREDDKATEEAPLGPGPLAALKEFMAMAEEDGFNTKMFGPWAGRVELGEGDELMGILGHVDVVPAGSGWETDPFDPVIKDEKIYARGALDDKGPTVAAYFAIKLLREMGHTFNKRVHLIVGTDEESGWQCMDHYFKEAEMPDFGFSPDAEFPIINGEKGNISAIFSKKASEAQEGDVELVSFHAGLRPNMVPESAKVEFVLAEDKIAAAQEAFQAFLSEHKLEGTFNHEGDKVTIELIGQAAHGSTPEKGVNAATFLAKFLNNFTFTQTGAHQFIQLLSHELFEGFDGSKVGVDYTHDVMGGVSMNIGIVNYTADDVQIDANFRFPEGTTAEEMLEKLKETLKDYDTLNIDMDFGHVKEPHYVPADDPLVETLLDIYARQTGFEAHEQSIGGGTYGRLMPRGVAYGVLFPDSTDTMHQKNEFIAIKDLLRATAIYAEAIYTLTK